MPSYCNGLEVLGTLVRHLLGERRLAPGTVSLAPVGVRGNRAGAEYTPILILQYLEGGGELEQTSLSK